jgi:hypothetical protein
MNKAEVSGIKVSLITSRLLPALQPQLSHAALADHVN